MKKQQRTVDPEYVNDFQQHSCSVGKRPQFRVRTFGPFPIGNRHFGDDEIVVEGLKGNLGLDFKSLGNQGNSLDKVPVESAVAGHDVRQPAVENHVDEFDDQRVAEDVKRSK